MLLDAVQLELQGRNAAVIAITECGASIAPGCVGGYHTAPELQSIRSSTLGGGIALMIHPSHHLLGSRVSVYYVAAAV